MKITSNPLKLYYGFKIMFVFCLKDELFLATWLSDEDKAYSSTHQFYNYLHYSSRRQSINHWHISAISLFFGGGGGVLFYEWSIPPPPSPMNRFLHTYAHGINIKPQILYESFRFFFSLMDPFCLFQSLPNFFLSLNNNPPCKVLFLKNVHVILLK